MREKQSHPMERDTDAKTITIVISSGKYQIEIEIYDSVEE